MIAILGLWGALIPFLGPYFDYSFATNSTWHYSTDRLWLNILPGALAVLGGLFLFMAATRTAGALGGWLAVLAGAWFVVGPAVSLTWESRPGPIGRPLYGSTRQTLELVGYFYGLGALILALAAFAIGRFASRPRIAEEEGRASAPDQSRRTGSAGAGRCRKAQTTAPGAPASRAAAGPRSEGDRVGQESHHS